MKKLQTYCLFLVGIIFQVSSSQEIVYNTDLLRIEKLKPNVFKHISFLETDDFGRVACNGMVYFSEDEALVFDTTVTNESSEVLIKWIQETNHKKIIAVIATHFHGDCLAGLKSFHENNIASYGSNLTVELAKKDNQVVSKHSFKSKTKIKVGNTKVLVKYFGAGHTSDNVVGYIKKEQTLFGGCLIKTLKAGKGNLADANVPEWSKTVLKIKKAYPDLQIVVPGHGKSGNTKLLDYTIDMFKQD